MHPEGVLLCILISAVHPEGGFAMHPDSAVHPEGVLLCILGFLLCGGGSVWEQRALISGFIGFCSTGRFLTQPEKGQSTKYNSGFVCAPLAENPTEKIWEKINSRDSQPGEREREEHTHTHHVNY